MLLNLLAGLLWIILQLPQRQLHLYVVTIDIQDDKCVVVSTDENEVVFTEDEIGNLFQDTSSEEEIDDE